MRATGYVSVAGLIVVSAAFRVQERAPEVPQAPAATSIASILVTPEVAVAAPAPPAIRIALQAGHWKAMEAPDELAGLRDNGTSFNGKAEWEVNLAIAERTAAVLREKGYEVDVLPATVPPAYKADLFISIHADGNNNSAVSGYRVAAPSASPSRRGRRSSSVNVTTAAPAVFTQRAEKSKTFADLLVKTYGEATGIPLVPTVTRRMQNYYAFNARRYQHALDPSTVAVILETGFLTSPQDRRIIVNDPDRSVSGIVAAVTQFHPVPPVVPSIQSSRRRLRLRRLHLAEVDR